MSEIEEVLTRLHVGIHSSDGINRLHWISFIDFVIHNPRDAKKAFVYKLVSIMGVRERTALEYVNCAIAWDVLRLHEGEIIYNKTYNKRRLKEGQKKLVMPDSAGTKEQIRKETE